MPDPGSFSPEKKFLSRAHFIAHISPSLSSGVFPHTSSSPCLLAQRSLSPVSPLTTTFLSPLPTAIFLPLASLNYSISLSIVPENSTTKCFPSLPQMFSSFSSERPHAFYFSYWIYYISFCVYVAISNTYKVLTRC